jgi:hypothetical protein
MPCSQVSDEPASSVFQIPLRRLQFPHLLPKRQYLPSKSRGVTNREAAVTTSFRIWLYYSFISPVTLTRSQQAGLQHFPSFQFELSPSTQATVTYHLMLQSYSMHHLHWNYSRLRFTYRALSYICIRSTYSCINWSMFVMKAQCTFHDVELKCLLTLLPKRKSGSVVRRSCCLRVDLYVFADLKFSAR